MAALTQDRNTPMMEGALIGVPVAAGVRIFAGSLVVANAAGYAEPGKAAANLTYLGRAERTVDNTGGGNGAVTALVRRKAAFCWANHSGDLVTQAELGKVCYIVDDQTVAKTHASNARSAAGRVLGVDADGVWVE